MAIPDPNADDDYSTDGQPPDFDAIYQYAGLFIQLGDLVWEYAHGAVDGGFDSELWTGDSSSSAAVVRETMDALTALLSNSDQHAKVPSAARMLWNIGETINWYAINLEKQRAKEQKEGLAELIGELFGLFFMLVFGGLAFLPATAAMMARVMDFLGNAIAAALEAIWSGTRWLAPLGHAAGDAVVGTILSVGPLLATDAIKDKITGDPFKVSPKEIGIAIGLGVIGGIGFGRGLPKAGGAAGDEAAVARGTRGAEGLDSGSVLGGKAGGGDVVSVGGDSGVVLGGKAGGGDLASVGGDSGSMLGGKAGGEDFASLSGDSGSVLSGKAGSEGSTLVGSKGSSEFGSDASSVASGDSYRLLGSESGSDGASLLGSEGGSALGSDGARGIAGSSGGKGLAAAADGQPVRSGSQWRAGKVADDANKIADGVTDLGTGQSTTGPITGGGRSAPEHDASTGAGSSQDGAAMAAVDNRSAPGGDVRLTGDVDRSKIAQAAEARKAGGTGAPDRTGLDGNPGGDSPLSGPGAAKQPPRGNSGEVDRAKVAEAAAARKAADGQGLSHSPAGDMDRPGPSRDGHGPARDSDGAAASTSPSESMTRAVGQQAKPSGAATIAHPPKPGRQVLRTDEHGNVELVRMNEPHDFRGTGDTLNGVPVKDRALGSASSDPVQDGFTYVELRGDGTTAATVRSPDEHPISVERAAGAGHRGSGSRTGAADGSDTYDLLLMHDPKTSTWKMENVGHAGEAPPKQVSFPGEGDKLGPGPSSKTGTHTDPVGGNGQPDRAPRVTDAGETGAGDSGPSQILRRNDDGSIDLLTFQRPPSHVPGGDGPKYHDLDVGGSGGWRSGRLDTDEVPAITRIMRPDDPGHYPDGSRADWDREPTAWLAHEPGKGWTPVAEAKGPQSADGGASAAEGGGRTYHRWDPDARTFKPVEVKGNELHVAEVKMGGDVSFDKYAADGGPGGSHPKLKLQSDGSLTAEDAPQISIDRLHVDPQTGRITHGGPGEPNGGGSHGGDAGPDGGSGAGKSGGTKLGSVSRGSQTQVDHTITLIKQTPKKSGQETVPVAKDKPDRGTAVDDRGPSEPTAQPERGGLTQDRNPGGGSQVEARDGTTVSSQTLKDAPRPQPQRERPPAAEDMHRAADARTYTGGGVGLPRSGPQATGGAAETSTAASDAGVRDGLSGAPVRSGAGDSRAAAEARLYIGRRLGLSPSDVPAVDSSASGGRTQGVPSVTPARSGAAASEQDMRAAADARTYTGGLLGSKPGPPASPAPPREPAPPRDAADHRMPEPLTNSAGEAPAAGIDLPSRGGADSSRGGADSSRGGADSSRGGADSSRGGAAAPAVPERPLPLRGALPEGVTLRPGDHPGTFVLSRGDGDPPYRPIPDEAAGPVPGAPDDGIRVVVDPTMRSQAELRDALAAIDPQGVPTLAVHFLAPLDGGRVQQIADRVVGGLAADIPNRVLVFPRAGLGSELPAGVSETGDPAFVEMTHAAAPAVQKGETEASRGGAPVSPLPLRGDLPDGVTLQHAYRGDTYVLFQGDRPTYRFPLLRAPDGGIRVFVDPTVRSQNQLQEALAAIDPDGRSTLVVHFLGPFRALDGGRVQQIADRVVGGLAADIPNRVLVFPRTGFGAELPAGLTETGHPSFVETVHGRVPLDEPKPGPAATGGVDLPSLAADAGRIDALVGRAAGQGRTDPASMLRRLVQARFSIGVQHDVEPRPPAGVRSGQETGFRFLEDSWRAGWTDTRDDWDSVQSVVGGIESGTWVLFSPEGRDSAAFVHKDRDGVTRVFEVSPDGSHHHVELQQYQAEHDVPGAVLAINPCAEVTR
ncbi:hypothetical protein AB0J83_20865 [Actinoplanes sp. NPDC049596]|uniref:hypothetical protein n=1 Tax=unclassified Actinoplanes TaxID=2626549 RepID=UPI003429B22C